MKKVDFDSTKKILELINGVVGTAGMELVLIDKANEKIVKFQGILKFLDIMQIAFNSKSK